MNRIKQLKMSPEVAYRFAIGEIQIVSRETLEDKFPEEMHTFFVLSASEPADKFFHATHNTKVSDYVKKYYEIMASSESFLLGFGSSPEFMCNLIWDGHKNGRKTYQFNRSRDVQKEWEKPNVLTEEEKEIFLKSPKWAVKYAKFTKKRFPPSLEKRFIEGKEVNNHASRTAKEYILEYCKFFSIILDNYNEILLKEGFGEKSSESEANKSYLKKIQEEKEKCKTFLAKIIESNSLNENTDSIKKLMECLC